MKFKHFSIEEREKIQEMLWAKQSIRDIAKALDRSPSSVSRELKKNIGKKGKYGPRISNTRALEKREKRGRETRLKNDRIRKYVIIHLKRRWSPEQISGRIKMDIGENISYEAIYQYIYAQVQNGTNNIKPNTEDLRPYLRRRRRMRRPKGLRKVKRVLKPQGKSIDLRPVIVLTRKRIGDWEGDTVESKDHKPGINTLVERKTGFTFITKLKDKSSKATVEVMEKRFREIPEGFKHTVTLDNGPENTDWRGVEKACGMECYNAHPYSAFERPTNENTNGLVRDYFPKKTDFTKISNDEISYVEYELNTRPRKRLGWRTPLETLRVAIEG